MALLEQLIARAGADPASTWFAHQPYRAAKASLDGLGGPEEELPSGHLSTKTELFRRPLPAEAIAALVDGLARGRAPGQVRELAFTPLGGARTAASRPTPRPTPTATSATWSSTSWSLPRMRRQPPATG